VQAFREAVKLADDSNQPSTGITAMLGLVRGQLEGGEVEDAEAQLELLAAMHESDELGAEYHFVRAVLLRLNQKQGNEEWKTQHLEYLNSCKEKLMFQTRLSEEGIDSVFDPKYSHYAAKNVDSLMSLAMEHMSHAQPHTPASVYLPSLDTISQVTTQTNHSLNSNDNTQYTRSITTNTTRQMVTLSGPLQSVPLLHPNNLLSKSSTHVTPILQNIPIPNAVACGLEILSTVLRICPGALNVYIETAVGLASVGRYEDASRSLQQCLSLHPRNSAVLVQKARIETYRGSAFVNAGEKSLEQALSIDFSVRTNPMYRLVQARILSLHVKYEDSIAILRELVSSREIRYVAENKIIRYEDNLRLSDDDRVSAFILLGYLYGRTKRLKEAKSIFGDAKSVFGKSNQEPILLLASAQFAADRQEYDTALKLLDQIEEDSSAYQNAQSIKAELLLTQMRDREGYLRVYKQLVDRNPNVQTFTTYGEACLRILRPDSAVLAFQSAYNLDKSNTKLR
jgi:tetratricopeptide (TPR) repeat protein